MIGFTISIEFALQRAMMHASRAAGEQRIAPDQFTGLHPKGGWTPSFGTYLSRWRTGYRPMTGQEP